MIAIVCQNGKEIEVKSEQDKPKTDSVNQIRKHLIEYVEAAICGIEF